MRILGIDPGLATIGLGLIEAQNPSTIQAVDWLTICTPAGMDTPLRLQEIENDLEEYLTDTKPDAVVIEKLFFATNQKTAIDVAQARGVLLLTVAKHSIPTTEITPLQLKSAITGDGQADKLQVQQMLKMMLQLDEIPQPDDAADALALAVYGGITNIPSHPLGKEG